MTNSPLTLFPILFRWCGDEALIEKTTTLFANLIPLAVGVGQAARISKMLDRLYSVSHHFLDKLSNSSYKIRHRWLYKYLIEHPIAQDFDNETLMKFAKFKVGMWAHERDDYQANYSHEVIAERLL